MCALARAQRFLETLWTLGIRYLYTINTFLFDLSVSEEILIVFVWLLDVYLDDSKENKISHFPVISDYVI